MSTEYSFWLIIEVVVLGIIFVPTMIAFLSGAPWVPTPIPRILRMLELADIKHGDRIYDLGCGDGRIPHLAAKLYGADAIGLELSPLLYFAARIRNFFLRSKSKILLRDFRRINYGNAHALIFYLLPATLKKLSPKFSSELQTGALIVSYAFQIEGWTPVYVEPKAPEKNYAPIYVYQIPQSVGKLMNENGAAASE